MPEQEASIGEPDRLGITINELEMMYEVLDYQRPESAILATAQLLIKTLSDEEISHGIARCSVECHKVIARDIIARAKGDDPIPERSLLDGLPRLNGALAQAQMEFPPVPKRQTATKRYQDKKSGDWKEFTYKYADLADILTTVLPILGKHGLAITQPFVRRGQQDRLYLVTQVRHISGEVLTSAGLVMPNEETVSPQEFGSQHSYWRRYDLSGTIGVAAVEDDDGQFSQRSAHEATPDSGRTQGKRSASRTDADKESLKTGDPNAGHGNSDSPKPEPRKTAPTTPAPEPKVTDEKVPIVMANGEKQIVDWKRCVGRVQNVTGIIEAKNKQKSKYVQVIVEGLATSNRKEEGKPYVTSKLFHCFRTTLFECLKLSPGELCDFYFDPAENKGMYWQNIEEVLAIGERKFANGKPVEATAEPKAEEKKPELEPSSPTGLFDPQDSTAKK
jgi:hypothetical protein